MKDLKEIIKQIDKLKSEADQLGPLDKNAKERLEQKIRLDWNYHSNVIEGNQLDQGETRSLLLHGLTANGKPLKDHLDMKGHNDALKKLEGMAGKEIKITENLIKEFHKVIIEDPFNEYPDMVQGEYKRNSNYLYNHLGERVDFMDPEIVAKELNELINWTNNAIEPPKRKKAKYDTHPLLIATIFHMRFINIHPFDDGNGRICRIMMNLILMQCGYPPIIIKKEDRDTYFRSIQKAREEGDEHLAIFLGKELINSLELYIRAAKGEAIEEPDDLDKKITILKQKIEGLDEEEIKVKRSTGAIKKLLDKSLLPINELIDKKLSDLKDLFNEYEKLLFFNGTGSRYYTSIDIDNALQKDAAQTGRINDITFSYRLLGFKKGGTNSFSIEKGFSIQIKEWHYDIHLDHKQGEKIYSGLYHKQLSSAEIEKFSKRIVEEALKEIDQKVEGLNPKGKDNKSTN